MRGTIAVVDFGGSHFKPTPYAESKKVTETIKFDGTICVSGTKRFQAYGAVPKVKSVLVRLNDQRYIPLSYDDYQKAVKCYAQDVQDAAPSPDLAPRRWFATRFAKIMIIVPYDKMSRAKFTSLIKTRTLLRLDEDDWNLDGRRRPIHIVDLKQHVERQAGDYLEARSSFRTFLEQHPDAGADACEDMNRTVSTNKGLWVPAQVDAWAALPFEDAAYSLVSCARRADLAVPWSIEVQAGPHKGRFRVVNSSKEPPLYLEAPVRSRMLLPETMMHRLAVKAPAVKG
jgi:hypothetical protein